MSSRNALRAASLALCPRCKHLAQHHGSIGCSICAGGLGPGPCDGRAPIDRDLPITEVPLAPRKGPSLFQQVIDVEPGGTLPPRPPRIKAPHCQKCADLKLRQQHVPTTGNRWACGRGHGITGGVEKA